jgi:hypothetical protein
MFLPARGQVNTIKAFGQFPRQHRSIELVAAGLHGRPGLQPPAIHASRTGRVNV